MTDEELSISDATLIARLRMIHEWKVGNAAADRIERLAEAFGILEDALQEVGDDYPESSLQEWCQQQIRFAHYTLKGN